MSIASQADTLCGPHALPGGAAPARLDRMLALLADLGDAIRDEIARSLAPMAAEVEAARKLVSMLEVRVRDLEARQAATAVAAGDPDFPDHATGRAVEAPPESTTERAETVFSRDAIIDSAGDSGSVPAHSESAADDEAQGDLAAATATASPGPQALDPVPLSAAMEVVAEQQTPAEAPTRRKKPRKAAAPKGTTVAPAPAVTITVVLEPGASASAPPVSVALTQCPSMNAATVSVSVTVAATETEAPVVDTPDAPVSGASRPTRVADIQERPSMADVRAEVVPSTSGPSVAAPLPGGGFRAGMRPDAAGAMPRERAAGILHPLLEKGAREMIAFGLYPDMSALLDEAVYRLLESDYPADPGG